MAYLKLFKVESDFALGFQTLNQARDNGEAMKDLYDVNHSLGVDGYMNPYGLIGGLLSIGRHDDRLIARTVLRFAVDTTLPTPVAVPLVGGPMTFAPPVRLGVGQWQVRLLNSQLIGAVGLAESNAIVDRKVTCLVANGSGSPSITVSTWNVATPALADFNFDLVVWAYSA